jgi:hypothetical protein
MQRYKVTIELEMRTPGKLTDAEIEDAKDTFAKAITPVPLLPQGAHTQSQSITISESEE